MSNISADISEIETSSHKRHKESHGFRLNPRTSYHCLVELPVIVNVQDTICDASKKKHESQYVSVSYNALWVQGSNFWMYVIPVARAFQINET